MALQMIIDISYDIFLMILTMKMLQYRCVK